jgi:hypothetical protein
LRRTGGRAHQESARVGLAAADRLIVRVRQVLIEEALGLEETTGSDGGGGGGGGRHLMLHQMAQLFLNSRSGDRKEKVHDWSELQCQWSHHYSTWRFQNTAPRQETTAATELNGKKTLTRKRDAVMGSRGHRHVFFEGFNGFMKTNSKMSDTLQ